MITVALGAVVAVGAGIADAPPQVPADSFRARVAYVSDGDTFGISSTRRGVVPVRIIGIDTPEISSPRECFGGRATKELRRVIGSSVVTLAYQRQRRDRYGRDLLDVWTADGRFVAGVLTRRGYARTLAIPPNTRHASYLARAERRARDADRGLWGAC